MPLTCTFYGGVSARRSDPIDLGMQSYSLDLGSVAQVFGSGTATGQASVLYSGSRTIAASTFEDLDLRGILTTGLNEPAIFTAVKGLYFRSPTNAPGNLIIGGAAANPWPGPFGTGKITLPAGGLLELIHPTTGWPVTADTADLLRVENAGASSVAYAVVIAGV